MAFSDEDTWSSPEALGNKIPIPKKKRPFRQKQFIATRQAGATFTAPASSPHDTARLQLTAFPRVKKLIYS
jgi:hypothetical protein